MGADTKVTFFTHYQPKTETYPCLPGSGVSHLVYLPSTSPISIPCCQVSTLEQCTSHNHGFIAAKPRRTVVKEHTIPAGLGLVFLPLILCDNLSLASLCLGILTC